MKIEKEQALRKLAQDFASLRHKTGVEFALSWYQLKCAELGLVSIEQVEVLSKAYELLINADSTTREPKIHPFVPATTTVVKASPKTYTCMDDSKQNVNVSSGCLDAARRLLGKGARGQMDFCYGDGYYANSCRRKYGERMFDAACEIVSKEK